MTSDCVCGMAANDPTHPDWHELLIWNQAMFARGRAEREREFDGDLEVHRHRHGMDADRQGAMEVGSGATTTFRANG